MSRRLRHAVEHWLRAERDASADAESGLLRVFGALPAPCLPDRFAERVMLGAGLAVPRQAAIPLAWRVALAASLLIAAASAATIPRFALGLLRQISPGDLLRFFVSVLVETCQRLAEGLAVWQTAASVGDTLAAVLSSPTILTALLAATLLSAGGFRMLYGLLAIDRRSENARA